MLELKKRLIQHEGLKLKPYTCSQGKLTIGVGRNLVEKGITKSEALFLLENDIKEAKKLCEVNFPFFDRLSLLRQEVLIEMCFNLGISKLKQFKKMLLAIEQGDFELASVEMLDSLWAKQVKNRAVRLAKYMRENK